MILSSWFKLNKWSSPVDSNSTSDPVLLGSKLGPRISSSWFKLFQMNQSSWFKLSKWPGPLWLVTLSKRSSLLGSNAARDPVPLIGSKSQSCDAVHFRQKHLSSWYKTSVVWFLILKGTFSSSFFVLFLLHRTFGEGFCIPSRFWKPSILETSQQLETQFRLESIPFHIHCTKPKLITYIICTLTLMRSGGVKQEQNWGGTQSRKQ
jgi:hypothetical protein